MPVTKNSQRLLWLILAIALAIRLVMLFVNGWITLPIGGGDGYWYLVNGQGLFMPEPTGLVRGYPYAANALGIAPLYLVFNGLMQVVFGYVPALGAIRLIQIAMTIFVCYFAYDLGRLITHDVRVGLLASLALALSIAWIIEPYKIMTETLYITLIIGGIWCYCRWLMPQLDNPRWMIAIVVGALLGLATLTRAVGLLFPLGIAGHIVLIAGRQYWRKGLQIALVILASYGLMISTWTVYNLVRYDRFIIVSNQFFPTVWRGASDEDGSPSENDALLGEQTAQEQSAEIISSDPTNYLLLRVRELSEAYLQPYSTNTFGGESLKDLALDWVNTGFSGDGLQQLISADAFLPKLMLYIWHYVAVIGGIIGMWLSRHQWRMSAVLIGFIAYTTLIHSVLHAIPRYIFPTHVFYVIFASVTLIAIWDSVRGQSAKEAE